MVKDNTTGIIVLLIIASAFLFAYNNSGLMSLAELTTSISFPPDNLVHSVSFENYRADIKVYTGTKWTGECNPGNYQASCGFGGCGVDSNGCTLYAGYLKNPTTCTYDSPYSCRFAAPPQGGWGGCSNQLGSCGSAGGGSKTEQICQYDYSISKDNQTLKSAIGEKTSFYQKLDDNTIFIFGESTTVNSMQVWQSYSCYNPSGCSFGSYKTYEHTYIDPVTKKSVTEYVPNQMNSDGTLNPLKSLTYAQGTSYMSSQQISVNTNGQIISGANQEFYPLVAGDGYYYSKPIPQQCENMMGRFIFVVNDDDFKFSFNTSNNMLFASIQNNLRPITATPCFDYNFTINGFMYGQEKCFAEETFNVGKNDMMFALPSDIPHDFKVTPKFKNMKIMVNGASTSISDYVGLEYSILEAQPVQVNNTSIQNTSSTQNSTLQSVTTTTRSWWQSFIDWLYAMWIWILSVFK